MINRGSSKSNLFLMELIILILFFSIASAICVRLFVSAHLDSLESAALNRAVLAAQSAVEVYKNADDPGEAFSAQLNAAAEGGGFVVRYDAEWQPLPEGKQPAYLLKIILSEDGNVGEVLVDVLKESSQGQPLQEETIYTLRAKKLLF